MKKHIQSIKEETQPSSSEIPNNSIKEEKEVPKVAVTHNTDGTHNITIHTEKIGLQAVDTNKEPIESFEDILKRHGIYEYDVRINSAINEYIHYRQQSQSVESIAILLNHRIAELQDMKGLSKRETELPINELEYMLSKINGGKYLSTESIVGFVLEWVINNADVEEYYPNPYMPEESTYRIDKQSVLGLEADIIKWLKK